MHKTSIKRLKRNHFTLHFKLAIKYIVHEQELFRYSKKNCTSYRVCLHAKMTKGSLRTVPTIVLAHTFCASRDTRISYGWCLLIQGYFCAVQTMRRLQNLASALGIQKRKFGVTTHFAEIIKLQFGKRTPYIALYFKALYKYC